jgi:hypothetical protein
MKNNRYKRMAVVLSAAILSLIVSACGKEHKPVYPVHGKGLDKNAKAAAGAIIVFHPVVAEDPKEAKPIGTVDENGEFTLTTYKTGDGAPAGEYCITLAWFPPRKSIMEPEKDDVLGGRFALPEKSPIPKFTVEASGANEAPAIQLK